MWGTVKKAGKTGKRTVVTGLATGLGWVLGNTATNYLKKYGVNVGEVGRKAICGASALIAGDIAWEAQKSYETPKAKAEEPQPVETEDETDE